jgi:uncharacterized protein (DUF427 family)
MTMSTRIKKIPGPDHPITLVQSGKTMRVIYRGETIAESSDALVMREASYPPVVYFPRKDVKMTRLLRTDHNTWCPYKGEASYYTLVADDARDENAVWSYETPFDAVEGIRERLAFYPSKIDRIEEA